ncbi:hypothetical protein QBC46DRAFT_321470 [Diplogelasinospora grovesii]|uniref:Uncharacterized protein n=1 Tax=Diplogelasinospora grovesii TaxID=303347 RepID=A0AAN6S0A8_9PEZI|nr:hypothetical protein QBC46DRAFT_321470 [Diplogelasinospora grovesii]
MLDNTMIYRAHRLKIAIAIVIILACARTLLSLPSTIRRSFSAPPPPQQPPVRRIPDVEIAAAKMKGEDTSWFERYLSQWRANTYVVNDPTAELTVPANKGREAMVYLTYIIDRYHSLPDIVLFLHAERFQWHNDNPDYDGLWSLQNLNLSHIRTSGYVNLRCVWVLGCPGEIKPVEDEAATPTDGSSEIHTKHVFKRALQELLPGMDVPTVVGVPCCAQFAVTREAILQRPREDYVRYRKWLLETPLGDNLSGRVLEYAWHIVFGTPAVHCPAAGDCYCKLYGLCGLDCQENECQGRYVLPRAASLPEGWPKIGWNGAERDFKGPLE